MLISIMITDTFLHVTNVSTNNYLKYPRIPLIVYNLNIEETLIGRRLAIDGICEHKPYEYKIATSITNYYIFMLKMFELC